MVPGKVICLFRAKSAIAFRKILPVRVHGNAVTGATKRSEATGPIGMN